MLKLKFIAAACGLGAKRMETQFGPALLKGKRIKHFLKQQGIPAAWRYLAAPTQRLATKEAEILAIAQFANQLKDIIIEAVEDQQFPVILGGDHSIAIGTWAGLTTALNAKRKFGLLWIDAHLDSHTFVTTPSEAIHGMPVATLLGYGDPRLLSVSGAPSIDPEHLVIFGARSYEAGEHALLERLGVKIFYQSMIEERGFISCFNEALALVRAADRGFGISLDLDAFDPEDAPGVGSREVNGLWARDMVPALAGLSTDTNFKALEIAEYNPARDSEHKTQIIIARCLEAIFGKEEAYV